MDTKNPHSVKNVNQPQGPRVGNEGAHKAKRGNFKAEKAEREPLARMVQDAYAAREVRDYAGHDFPNDGSIDENSHIKKFKASKR